MQTSYIYSTSRFNTLSEALLSSTDIERLMVEETGAAVHEALKETYLAPYVAQTPGENMVDAIEMTLIEAKRLIQQVTPNSELFQLLWMRNDIHNLRVFVKATVKGYRYEELLGYVSNRGKYTPEYLYGMVETSALNRLEIDWQDAYDEAARYMTAGEIDRADATLDQLFFATAKNSVARHNDAFMQLYLRAIIDVSNIKARLRVLRNPNVSTNPVFITGGTFAEAELDSKEQIFAALGQLGGEDHWRSAAEQYTETGNTTQIDARADDYLLSITRKKAYDMFSSASIVLYYLRARQAAANIRTIVVGKETSMADSEITANLRTAYVNK